MVVVTRELIHDMNLFSGGGLSLHTISFGTVSFWCYSCLCWYVAGYITYIYCNWDLLPVLELRAKKLDKCLKVRNLLREWEVETYFLKKLSLTSCLIALCVVCGAAIMWIGVVWIPEGLQVVF